MNPHPAQHPSRKRWASERGHSDWPVVSRGCNKRCINTNDRPAAGTMTTNPRHVLLAPKIRRERNVNPASMATANRRAALLLSHTVCTIPASKNARKKNRVQKNGSGIVMATRLGGGPIKNRIRFGHGSGTAEFLPGYFWHEAPTSTSESSWQFSGSASGAGGNRGHEAAYDAGCGHRR